MNYVSVDVGFAGDVKVTSTASGRVKLTLGNGYLATYFDRHQAVSLLQQLRDALEAAPRGRRQGDASVGREIRRDTDSVLADVEIREGL